MAEQAKVLRFPGAAQPADPPARRELSDDQVIARFADFWTNPERATPTVRREIRRIVLNEERREAERARRERYEAVARVVLDDLNEKRAGVRRELGRRPSSGFPPVAANLRLICARLAEGYEPSDLRAINSVKARQVVAGEWSFEWLRPATLYNATKCAQYRAELGA